MDDFEDYSIPVHKALMEKHQLFGVGEKPFYLILIITVILASLVSVYCIGVGVIALIVCRQICKDDSLKLDLLMDNLQQNNIYMG